MKFHLESLSLGDKANAKMFCSVLERKEEGELETETKQSRELPEMESTVILELCNSTDSFPVCTSPSLFTLTLTLPRIPHTHQRIPN